MRPHPRRARTNPSSPRAWATDMRSGFIGNAENLVYQYEYRGTQLINTQILVYRDQLDEPNPQLKTIILSPDPVSITNARPEPYAIEEQTMRITEDGQIRYLMDGTVRLESNLQGVNNAGTYPG